MREVYGKNGDKVVVVDARDIYHGEFTVDVLLNDGGYKTVFASPRLDCCIAKAKELETRAVWSAYGTPIPNVAGGLIGFSR